MFQERHVQCLIGHQLFQPRVLDFQLLEMRGIVGLHPAVLRSPAVKGLLAEAKTLDDLGHRPARRQHGFGLT